MKALKLKTYYVVTIQDEHGDLWSLRSEFANLRGRLFPFVIENNQQLFCMNRPQMTRLAKRLQELSSADDLWTQPRASDLLHASEKRVLQRRTVSFLKIEATVSVVSKLRCKTLGTNLLGKALYRKFMAQWEVIVPDAQLAQVFLSKQGVLKPDTVETFWFLLNRKVGESK